jgi:hypothetical protein
MFCRRACSQAARAPQACHVVAQLAAALGPRFDAFALAYLPALFKVVVITVQARPAKSRPGLIANALTGRGWCPGALSMRALILALVRGAVLGGSGFSAVPVAGLGVVSGASGVMYIVALDCGAAVIGMHHPAPILFPAGHGRVGGRVRARAAAALPLRAAAAAALRGGRGRPQRAPAPVRHRIPAAGAPRPAHFSGSDSGPQQWHVIGLPDTIEWRTSCAARRAPPKQGDDVRPTGLACWRSPALRDAWRPAPRSSRIRPVIKALHRAPYMQGAAAGCRGLGCGRAGAVG